MMIIIKMHIQRIYFFVILTFNALIWCVIPIIFTFLYVMHFFQNNTIKWFLNLFLSALECLLTLNIIFSNGEE